MKATNNEGSAKKVIRSGHYFLFDLDDRVIHSRLSEANGVKIKSQSFPAARLSSLVFGAMISDRRVYNPNDTIRILVASPGGAGRGAHLDILYGGKREVLSDNFVLDDYGVHLCELKGIEETGEYTATVTTSATVGSGKNTQVETKSFNCDFTIAQHTLSPLLVQIKKQVISGDTLDAELLATVLNQPYTGSMRVGLYCDYCKQVVNEMSAETKKGSFSLKIGLSGHTGPFRLEFSTPDGNTASVSLQSTRVEERQEIQVGNLGEIVNVALIPIPDGTNVRGINWAPRGTSTAPVIVKSAESDRIDVHVARNLDYVYVHSVNPFTKEAKQWFKGPVKEGEEYSFKNSAPYQIVLVGCIINAKEQALFEGRTIVFCPEELEVKVSAPSKVEPSEEVTITLETNKKAQCLLMVFDERLDTENITGKLGKDIYNQIKTLGSIEELMMQFEPKREEVLEAREMTRPSGTGSRPYSAQPSAVPPMVKMAARAMAAPLPSALMKSGTARSYAAADIGTVAAMITAEMPAYMAAAPRRAWFPKILACKLIEVEGVHEERVRLGDTITKWKVQVYAFADLDYISNSIDIEADRSVVVDVDVPSMIDEGDEYYGKAVYHVAEGKAKLRVKLPDGSFYEGEVEGDGFREFKLPGPGTVEAELTSPKGSDSIVKSVDPQVSEKVTVSALSLLEKGEELPIDVDRKVFIYTNVKSLLSYSVRSLIQYPFGCAEQTSAKLCGLAVAWEFGENTNEIAQMIDAGLSRMTKFIQQDGLYSLWEGAKEGTPEVTKKVLKNLSPLIRLGRFKEKTTPLIEKPVQELEKRKVADNTLLSLSEKFMAPMTTVEDAANIAIYSGGKRKEALKFIESKAVEGSGGTEVHWEPAQATWGGVLESTATCLRALHASADDKHQTLFRKGFKFVGKRIVGGRLHSTADTRALIELFGAMKDMDTKPKFYYQTYMKSDPSTPVTKTEKDFESGDSNGIIAVDDEAESDMSAKGRRLIAHSMLFARVDGIEVIDYKKTKSNFNFDMKLEKMSLKLGERIKLTLTPKDQSICPVSKVFLPANVAFLEGGVNVQTISKPITEGSIVLDLIGTARGKCRLYAVLYDMYDSNMVGVAIPARVDVTSP
ncbi:MAG: hypothetical protein WED05_10435 [Candidatus Atabeyarchaeum deiterrae]